MTTKHHLITDSFKVVKRRRRAEKRAKPPPPPPQTEPEPTPQMDREKELQELRQFDLDWQYGPCTDAKSIFSAFLPHQQKVDSSQKVLWDSMIQMYLGGRGYSLGSILEGITRLQRWERAELHGLHPPTAIRDLLLRSHSDMQYTRSLWSDYPL